MEELKRTWFQIVWAGLLLASVAMSYLVRYSAAEWVQSRPVEVFKIFLDCITITLTVVLFVVHNIENWRVGRRYFWRVCRRWGGALLGGALMATVLVALVKFFKSGWMFDGNIYDTEVKTFLFVLFSLGGLLYMIARYKFNHPNKD